MKFGQMSLPRVSANADYIQLDICGLNKEQTLSRFLSYETNLPVILHGDWTKKGASENNIAQRKQEYVTIIQTLLKHTSVLGFTMHPPFRKKMSLEEFLFHCKDIEQQTDISVFIENRSNEKIWLSNPEEIIEFSTKHLMTIDFAQLFISCGFNQDVFRRTLEKIQWRNIKELHVANIKRDGNRTYVARKLDDGMLRLQDLTSHFEYVPYATLEILGGVPTFEDQVEQLRSYFREGC